MGDTIGLWLNTAFRGDAPQHPLSVGQVAARALIVYIVWLAIVRVGKSRLLGNATALDVVLAVVFGSLLSRAINGTASISGTVVACLVLVGLHWLMTQIACRSHRFGNLVKGHCYLLVDNGHVNVKALRRSHLSHDDLLEGLRLNANVDDLAGIEKAYKERSGQVSGVRRKMRTQLIDVPVEGGVKTVRIELSTD